jgi:hypothetical protein
MIDRVHAELKGKKILFVAAKFYHYTEAVFEKLKLYGANVDFFYERDISLKHVVVANFFASKMDKWQQKHYRSILRKTENRSFDYLIVIRGYRMPVWFVETLKERNPNMATILYQWDVFRLWDADYRYLMPHFDRTLSFDYADSKELNIPYAPTFHMDEYSNPPEKRPIYDFIYCTNHTDEKYRFMNAFVDLAAKKGYRVRTHLYMSWLKYLREYLKGNRIDYGSISFRRLSREEYFGLFCQSKVVVDFSGTTQTGLTMRVIDALGSGKRVLTNNKSVVNEPGYNSQQVIVYDPVALKLPDFVCNDEKFEKKDYSIDKWLDNLLFAR